MKITVTGSLGNVSKPLTKKLIAAGHQVTVISSCEDKAAAIRALGAEAAIGSIDDAAFITEAFTGADAVYTMVPPNFGATDYRGYIASVGRNYARAIADAGIKKVVNLSSIGADVPSGTGPIAGLYDVEEIFSHLDGVDVRHLRAGFFYPNFYNNIDMIRQMNMIGGNYGGNIQIILVHPTDIAAAAVQEFQNGFSGKSYIYVGGDQRSFSDVASVLGAAIGKPDLKWVEFTDQQSTEGMEKAGMPAPVARIYTEMGAAVRSGILFEDYKKLNPPLSGRIKLEEFAVEFAGRY